MGRGRALGRAATGHGAASRARPLPARRDREGRHVGLIDAHAHLTDERLVSDLDGVLRRAAESGVTRVLTCGEDLASSERALAIAEGHEIVRVAVGIHPHRAADLAGGAIDRLRELARHPLVVGIGEIGIDLSGHSAPRATQEEAFRAQLALAGELDLPVSVHVREAGDVVRDLIDRSPRVRGHVHCFSEGPDSIDAWIRRGFLVSFAGTVTFPRSHGLRAAAGLVPLDRLLVETDAPYLAPQGRRGRLNEPAFVAETYSAIRAVRGIPVDRLVQAVEDNAAALFGGRW